MNEEINVLPSYNNAPDILIMYLKKDKKWLESLPETGTRNRLLSLVNEKLQELQ